MVTTAGFVEFWLDGSNVFIDWDDGKGPVEVEIDDLPGMAIFPYDEPQPRTIKITGDVTLLDCNNTRLTELYVNNVPKLELLHCFDGELIVLNIKNCPSLEDLICRGNQLEILNITNCPGLVYIDCDYNLLTSLDLTGCPNLKGLACSVNELNSLNLSNSYALDWLNCNYNRLGSLNLSNCLSLTGLYCDDNELTSLDVSINTNLVELYCSGNPITNLYVSEDNKDLEQINCVNCNMDDAALNNLFEALPDQNGNYAPYGFYIKIIWNPGAATEPGPDCDYSIAENKGWDVYD